MGMEITKSFVVNAPADSVWAFLIDPYRVARCLPGAALTEKIDDATYAGTITVKVGPVTASYRGKLHFDRLDPAAREADLSASGQETKGKGGADMRMKSRVVERGPGETEVTVVSDVNVVGVLAQFGRGMIQDVSDQLFQKFSQAMRRELEGSATLGAAPVAPAAPASTSAGPAEKPEPAAATPPASAPPQGPVVSEEVLDLGAIGAQAAGRAALRMVSQPAFWVGAAISFVLVYLLKRR
ncbi:MAG TPA: SRPBCC family protein [Thermoanaerobaculia bacterium]|nr:SRPBCC family protein [Thermoanaerobaculia bacterium]